MPDYPYMSEGERLSKYRENYMKSMSKPMTNPQTDTNQASEDDKAIMIGFLYGIQSDFLPADEVRHRMAGFRNTQGYKEALALIRTEKLKLLAEVRERVIGEDLPPDVATDSGIGYSRQQFAINMGKAGQRKALTKMEAEL